MTDNEKCAVKRWWGREIVHTWGDWSAPYRANFSQYQMRKCSVCGKIETRYLGG